MWSISYDFAEKVTLIVAAQEPAKSVERKGGMDRKETQRQANMTQGPQAKTFNHVGSQVCSITLVVESPLQHFLIYCTLFFKNNKGKSHVCLA